MVWCMCGGQWTALLWGKSSETTPLDQISNWQSVLSHVATAWKGTLLPEQPQMRYYKELFFVCLFFLTLKNTEKLHSGSSCRGKQASSSVRAKNMQLSGTFWLWICRTGLDAFLWNFSGQGVETKDSYTWDKMEKPCSWFFLSNWVAGLELRSWGSGRNISTSLVSLTVFSLKKGGRGGLCSLERCLNGKRTWYTIVESESKYEEPT